MVFSKEDKILIKKNSWKVTLLPVFLIQNQKKLDKSTNADYTQKRTVTQTYNSAT